MNKKYMNKVYYYICYKYLHGKPERKIENLEKILFLMQHQSLRESNKFFLRYKIYIYNDEIRIRYISDLLRVSPIIDFGGDGMAYRKSMKYYQKKLVYFSKLSDDKLDERVKKIIEKGDLEEKYFVFEKYRDNRMRRIARLKMTEQKYHFTGSIEYGILAGISLRKAISMCLIMTFLIPALLCLPLLITSGSILYFKYFMIFFIIASIFIIIYSMWNYLWMRPTKYEIENGYLEE